MSNEGKKRNPTDYDNVKFLNFLEELCWLLDANKEIDFRIASKLMRQQRNNLVHSPKGDILNQNKEEHNLIGILPALLKDEEIFQSNSQLAQFAHEVLALSIARWEKKSRNEIIGLIICEVEDANRERLNILSDWSTQILKHKSIVQEFQKNANAKGSIFSWNETIQKLSGVENE